MSKGINPQQKNLVMGPAKTLTNNQGGDNPIDANSLGAMSQVKTGALTANTWAQMLVISGPGVLEFAGLSSDDTTSRTISIQIVIDGVQLVNVSATTLGGSYGHGVMAVGQSYSGSYAKQEIPFTTACTILVKSGLTETAKSTLFTSYRTC